MTHHAELKHEPEYWLTIDWDEPAMDERVDFAWDWKGSTGEWPISNELKKKCRDELEMAREERNRLTTLFGEQDVMVVAVEAAAQAAADATDAAVQGMLWARMAVPEQFARGWMLNDDEMAPAVLL